LYCPNCGGQNPDSATTCSNCGFNLKGASAPKFKGTMLMMNSPAVGGAAPPPGAPPASPPPEAPDAAALRRQMKGTIVGIAPPAMGAAPAPPTPPVDQSHSFAPPGGGAGVNPMGSTFVADGPPPAFPPPSPNFGGGAPFGAPQPEAPAAPPIQAPGGFGAPPPDAGGFGAPPPNAGGYGAPPPDAGGYGAPPNPGGFGGPPVQAPGGFGAPPPDAGGYGAPLSAPGAGFGAPNNAPVNTPGFGAPPGAMVPMTSGPMVPMGQAGLAGAGPVGTIRNPVTVLILSMVCFIVGLAQLRSLEDELNTFVGNGKKASILWFLFPLIPILGMPKLIAEARAKAGTPLQGEGNLIMYILLGPYMIPNDANQIWQHLGARPS
jgi:hypothetical protein